MTFKTNLLHGVIWTTAENWGRHGFGYLVFLILAALLDPADFGVVALAGIMVGLFELLVTQGYPTAIVQIPALHPLHLDSIFAVSLFSSLVLAITLFACAPLVAHLFDAAILTPVIRSLSPGLVLAALSAVPTGILMRELRFRALAIRSLASAAAGGFLGVTMALLGLGVWSLVGMQLLTSLVGLVCLWSSVTWRPAFRFSAAHLVDVIPMSSGLLGSALIWFVFQRADQSLIGAYLGTAALGQYSVGFRMVQLARDALVAPLSVVAVPAFAAVKSDARRLFRAYDQLTATACAVGLPVFGGLAAVAHVAIPLLLGQDWLPTVSVVQILSLTGALHILFIASHPLTLARQKVGVFFWLNVVHAGASLAGMLVGLHWGITGVATGVTVAWLASAGIGLAALRNVLGVRLRRFAASVAPPLLAASLMSLIVFVVGSVVNTLRIPSTGQLLLQIFAGVASYTAILSIVAPSLVRETLGYLAEFAARNRSSLGAENESALERPLSSSV